MAARSTEPVPMSLDEQLCLALYTASHAMTARYRPALADLGLTYPQYLVLGMLWENGSSAVGEIGAHLHLESSTLSPLIKRLETSGLVVRARDTSDERVVWVQLTRAGRALKAKASHIPAEICDAAGISLGAQARLVKQLHAVAAHLEESTRSVVRD